MNENNYEEYMSTVLGYNINPEPTYYNYNYNNDFELEKLYPKLNNTLNKYINEINMEITEKNLDEFAEEIYKKLNIKESSKETKNLILDLIKIIILNKKINNCQKFTQNRNVQNRFPIGFNPYIDF